MQGYSKSGCHLDECVETTGGDAKQNPLITVITVVYNAAVTMEQTILSVINQSYNNVEYIIIDGGSSDGTLDIIRKYEHAIDYWVSESDGGIYDAMNKAVSVASGEWIYFLGADDVLVNVLNDLAPSFSNHNTIYYGDVYMIRRHLLYDGPFNALKLALDNICHQAIFYPSMVFKKYTFDTKYKVWADYHLNMRCYGDSAFSFCYVNKLIAIFNDYLGVSAKVDDPQFEKDKLKLVRQYFNTAIYCCFLGYDLYLRARRKMVGILSTLGVKGVVKGIVRKIL